MATRPALAGVVGLGQAWEAEEEAVLEAAAGLRLGHWRLGGCWGCYLGPNPQCQC